MRIGIPKENSKNETRVAIVPVSVPKLMKLGLPAADQMYQIGYRE